MPINDQYLKLKDGGVARSISKGSRALIIKDAELYLSDSQGVEVPVGDTVVSTATQSLHSPD